MGDVVLQRIRVGWKGSAEGERNGDLGEAQGDLRSGASRYRPATAGVSLSPCDRRCACPQAEWCGAPGANQPASEAAPELTAAASDAGMSTVEYAVGTVVAAAFAAVLYKIVTGDSVIAGLTNLINTALSTSF